MVYYWPAFVDKVEELDYDMMVFSKSSSSPPLLVSSFEKNENGVKFEPPLSTKGANK